MPSMMEAADAPFRLTAPIEHITKLDDGTLLAHVTVTSETPDSQGEIVDYDAFKAAAPGLMKWAVLGEMHDPDRNDAGTILKLYFDDAARKVEADIHVVDPVAVRKVVNRVYKMVSIGGVKLATASESIGGRIFRRITKLLADELSLVPKGANPDAILAKQFVLAKRAQEPEMIDTLDAGTVSPSGDPPAASETRTPEQVAIDDTRAVLAKAEAADPDVGGGRVRSKIPDTDYVFPEDAPDGGFPIVSAGDVQDAVNSWGRYKGTRTFEEFKSRLTSIAQRKGFPIPKAWKKEQRKMAKAAKAAEAATTTETNEPIVKVDAPEEPMMPSPGAMAPMKGKAGKKAARKAAKAAKIAKLAAIAKGNKTVKALAEAYEALMCAISEESEEGDAEGAKALQAIADSIHQALSAEAAEGETDDEEFDPEMAMAYAKSRRRLTKRASRLLKARATLKKRYGKVRKVNAALRKERRELRKAAVFTSVLTKTGARNSASDMAKIDAIHAATVDLGTTAHKTEPDSTAAVETPLAKVDQSTVMREALAGIIPETKLAAIEARLIAIDERSTAQGEQIAKIAQQPSGGGPTKLYALGLRGGDEEVTDKASALEKAATVIDDPRLKEAVGDAAALELIRRQRGV